MSGKKAKLDKVWQKLKKEYDRGATYRQIMGSLGAEFAAVDKDATYVKNRMVREKMSVAKTRHDLPSNQTVGCRAVAPPPRTFGGLGGGMFGSNMTPPMVGMVGSPGAGKTFLQLSGGKRRLMAIGGGNFPSLNGGLEMILPIKKFDLVGDHMGIFILPLILGATVQAKIEGDEDSKRIAVSYIYRDADVETSFHKGTEKDYSLAVGAFVLTDLKLDYKGLKNHSGVTEAVGDFHGSIPVEANASLEFKPEVKVIIDRETRVGKVAILYKKLPIMQREEQNNIRQNVTADLFSALEEGGEFE